MCNTLLDILVKRTVWLTEVSVPFSRHDQVLLICFVSSIFTVREMLLGDVWTMWRKLVFCSAAPLLATQIKWKPCWWVALLLHASQRCRAQWRVKVLPIWTSVADGNAATTIEFEWIKSERVPIVNWKTNKNRGVIINSTRPLYLFLSCHVSMVRHKDCALI